MVGAPWGMGGLQAALNQGTALLQTDMDSDLVGDICDTNEDR